MGTEWFKNCCGIRLTDEEMERIPHSRTELTIHVTYRFSQMFGLVGALVIGPIVSAVKPETRNWHGVKDGMTRYGTGGVITGLAVGPILTAMLMRKQDDYRVWDRCYRLRNNRNQVHVDQFSFLGASCGAIAGSYLESGSAFGAIVGMTGGIILASLYNSATKERTTREKKH